MAKGGSTISYTFNGSAKQLAKLRKLIHEALAEAVPKPDPSGPIEDWGQNGGWVQDLKDGWGQAGGWYLVKENKKTRVARPDKVATAAITTVTATVVEALAKAKAQR